MLVTRVSRDDLTNALLTANKVFDNNLQFEKVEFAGYGRGGILKWNVKLRTIDSRKKGGRRGKGDNRRRVIVACWHAHGIFMDALPTIAVVKLRDDQSHTYDWQPGDKWPDFEVGSRWNRLWMSDLCDCDADGVIDA